MADPDDNAALNALLGGRGQRLSLEESKFLFRISVQTASTMGPLSRINIKHLTLLAFGVGLTLGAFPAARRALGGLAARYLVRPTQPEVINPLAGLAAGERLGAGRR